MIRSLVAVLAALAASWAASSAAAAGPPDDPVPVATTALEVTYQPEDERASPIIVDSLAPSTVLTISAHNLDGDTTGAVRQCVDDARQRCGNRLAIQTDSSGRATFQYLVTAEAVADGDEPCRLAGPRCTIELTVGGASIVVDTLFVDEAPPQGRLDVTPHRDVDLGDTVTITATGFPPGVDLEATVCVAPATTGNRCGSPAPVVPMTVGADGRAIARMTLDVAEVGAGRVACRRQATCRVVVSSDRTFARARPVGLTFRSTPSARYSTGRLLIGLAAASALLVTAGLLVRSGDWSPPTEADASSIDDAAFADLDAEAEAFVDFDLPPRPASRG